MWIGRVTINIIPDDVLLHIFFFDELVYRHTRYGGEVYLDGLGSFNRMWRLAWTWQRLTHVCRRWRSTIFASPNFLDLRLVCHPGTRAELIGIWPPLPIIITNAVGGGTSGDYNFDAAMVHPNRIREITLFHLTVSLLQRLVTQMQEQFPALMHLVLSRDHGPAPTLPDGFLGGSAPHLQSLGLDSIPFPALPKLLLSATDLVYLTLTRIPHSGHISPEAIVTGLAGMANLKSFILEFQSPLSRPGRERRRPPPPTRTVLPALAHFRFKGVSEYLEDLMARIDAPLLDSIRIVFFHQLIFEIPQLAQFMRRTTRFQTPNEAHVDFNNSGVRVGYSPPTRIGERSRLKISCRELDWQLSSLAQVFTTFFPSIGMVEHLYMYETPSYLPEWRDDIKDTQWLEIFEPFAAVKNLYLTKVFAPHVARALQGLVGSGMTEVLRTLQSIYLEGHPHFNQNPVAEVRSFPSPASSTSSLAPSPGPSTPPPLPNVAFSSPAHSSMTHSPYHSPPQPSGPILEGIGKFVAARHLSGHPITVFPWERPKLGLGS